MAEKPKKVRWVKVVLLVVILSIFLLAADYLVYEYRKLSLLGAQPFRDWRSYASYRLSSLPLISRYIKYEPLDVKRGIEVYREEIEALLKGLEEKEQEMRAREKELMTREEELKRKEQELARKEDALKHREEELKMKEEEWKDRTNRLKTLSNWLAATEPSQIAPALASTVVSIELLTDALRLLPDDVVGSILQSLAQIDPQRAARIINKLGE